MKSPQNPREPAVPGFPEETLKWIANLPAPEGLADRVQVRLRAEPPHHARSWSWSALFAPGGGWTHVSALRGVAAAAIVCVVAGGGWQVYSRVSPASGSASNPSATRFGVSRGFSSADAKHLPNNIKGPVLAHPLVPVPAETPSAQKSKPAHSKAKTRNKPATPPPVVPVQ